jgi:hypothetical protein
MTLGPLPALAAGKGAPLLYLGCCRSPGLIDRLHAVRPSFRPVRSPICAA